MFEKPKRHARCVCGHTFKAHSMYPNCDHEVGGQCVRGTCAGNCQQPKCRCPYYRAAKRRAPVKS